MDKVQAVFEYLNSKGWVPLEDCDDQISLLSRGENNENCLITAYEIYGEARYVFRVNHGSRLGLTDQAEYEFTVLQALRRSGVTPRPFYCDCSDCDTLGDGVLFMEYLPGRHFSYGADWELAAQVFAAVHSQPADGRLIVQDNPLGDMVRECSGLADRFSGPRNVQVRAGYESCLGDLRNLAEKGQPLMAGEPGVIIHGDLCASDFIVEEDGERAWLVDWESGVVSSRYIDLGQFMSQAAQAGEMGYCRNDAEKARFIEAYVEAAGLEASVDDIMHRAALFAEAAELRAMIWNCVALTGNLEGMK